MISRSSTAAPILAALAIVLLPLGAYVGGYYWLGAVQQWYLSGPGDPLSRGELQAIDRTYPNRLLANIYQPAGRVEAWLRGIEIKIASTTAP